MGLVATLAGVARRHPQTAYDGMQKSIQTDWSFFQCVTPDIGMAFQVVEDALRDVLLTDLFQGAMAQIPGRAITGMPVKQAEISLPDPTRTAGANYMASCVILGNLVTAFQGTSEFRSGNHALLVGEGRDEIRQRHVEEAETSLREPRPPR